MLRNLKYLPYGRTKIVDPGRNARRLIKAYDNCRSWTTTLNIFVAGNDPP